MQVFIPSQLRSYTGGCAELAAEGSSLAEVVDHLDGRYPGLRFRVVDEHGAIRPHIRFFVNRRLATSLTEPLRPEDELRIVGALSGG